MPVGGREAFLDVAEEIVVQADLVRVPGSLGLEAPAEQAAKGAVDEAEKAAPRLALAPARPSLTALASGGAGAGSAGAGACGPRAVAGRKAGGVGSGAPSTDTARASSRTWTSSAATSSRSSPT